MSKTPSFWVVAFEDDGMRIIAGSFQTYEQALHCIQEKEKKKSEWYREYRIFEDVTAERTDKPKRVPRVFVIKGQKEDV